MTKVVNLCSGEVVLNRPKRRSFPPSYKLRILTEVDASTIPGQIAALLRREGLYSSHLTCWRQQREEGILSALAPVKPGPNPRERNPLEVRVHQLEKEKRALKR